MNNLKVKELLSLLKTDYVEIADVNNPYQSVEYLRKDELDINPELLEAPVSAIEPLGTLKKKLFDASANDSDYVASIKILYGNKVAEDSFLEGDYEESYTKESVNESPFGNFGPMPNFTNLSGMGLPDMEKMTEIINSEEFQNFIDSGILDSLLPPELMNLRQNIDLSELFKTDDEDDPEE